MNGNPWQYPTCGSYLPITPSLVRTMEVGDNHSQRVRFQNVEKVLLPDTMAFDKEGVMWKCSAAT